MHQKVHLQLFGFENYSNNHQLKPEGYGLLPPVVGSSFQIPSSLTLHVIK